MSKQDNQDVVQAQDIPVTFLAQYIRDLSFENPNAFEVLSAGPDSPDMDLNIGMDARKLSDKEDDWTYEVVLSVRAEAKKKDQVMFIAEMQYGASVRLGQELPEESHHPFLLIEVPRLIFPFVRQIMSNLTVQGGYPPLLINPVDFHALYMQRFGKEIDEAREEVANKAKEAQ